MITHEIRIDHDDVIQAVKEWIDRNVTSVEEQDVSIDIRTYGGATIRLTPQDEDDPEPIAIPAPPATPVPEATTDGP